VNRSIAHVALVVRDYDEAIAFFTGVLGFTLVEDTEIPEQGKRWVLVRPAGSTGTSILLARPSQPGQEAFVGNQTGGRVSFFLRTDDFQRDYETLRARGVEFVRPPTAAPYGMVAVFKDLYGNLWDLLGPVAERE
jgi:catechol 2,3-dioxygenase-like lactoylglutathione lyase family enzyme